MGLGWVAGAGPFQDNTDEPYRTTVTGSLSDIGITIVDVGGVKYFRWTGTISNLAFLTEPARSLIDGDTQTYRWACVEAFRIEGVFGAIGDLVEVFNFGNKGQIRLFMECVTDTSTYRWQVRKNTGGDGVLVGTGTTEFAVGTTFHAIRVETGNGRVMLDVDTTQEFDVADAGKQQQAGLVISLSTVLQNGQTIHAHNLQLSTSNSRSDRPDHQDMGGGIMTLTGDKVSSEYSDHVDCAAGSDDGTEAHWDDWETGDADDATSFNCESGGAAGREVSDLSNPTVTNLVGVTGWARNRASVSAKTVAWDMIMEDTAGNIRSVGGQNLGTTAWINRSATFGNGPNITGWTSAVLNDSGIGVRSPNTNEANDEHTALMAEYFEMAIAPPSAAADRRRLLAA